MQVNGNEILIGCDPEVFVFDTNRGHTVPAHGLIEGTKEAPLLVKHGMVQVDGLALEFGIDAAATEDDFVFRVRSVMETLQSMLPPHLILHVEPITTFQAGDIDGLPPEALELGCDPDYNAYSQAVNPRPNLPNPYMRSAGGHVHVGWMSGAPAKHPMHIKACSALTAEMDWRLGVPSMSWDSNSLRRCIYGAAGAFRPKSYGMEYRTLSNQWLKKENIMRFVYRQTIKSVENTLYKKNNFNMKVPMLRGLSNLTPLELITNNYTLVGEALFRQENKNV